MNPHTNPITLDALITESKAHDAAYSRITVDTDNLQFAPEGILYRDRLIGIDQDAQIKLFTKVGAPGSYLSKHSRDFQAAALSEHARRGDFGLKPRVILRDGTFVTIADGTLSTLTDTAVLWAVAQGLGRDSEGLSVARISRDPECLDVELISHAKAAVIRPGDIVQGGLRIVHHRFGGHATYLETFVLRLVCSNGMTRRECGKDGIQRTRRLPADAPNSHELQMDQIRRLTGQTWRGLQPQLDALRATSTRPANVHELLIRWLQRARISTNSLMPRLLAAWRLEGEENTHFGAVNALTRVATHDSDLSERQRRLLAALAGILAFSEVHVCPRCFSVLANSAADNTQMRSEEPVTEIEGRFLVAA